MIHAIASQASITTKTSFHDEARWQAVCAVCHKGGAFHAHHVILEQHLVKLGWPRYDTRNARRICTATCHHRHHHRIRRIRIVELTDENLVYAFMVFGIATGDYLARYYDTDPDDPRIAQLTSYDGLEPVHG